MKVFDIQIGFGKEVPKKISLNIYFSGCKNNKECERDKCQNKHLHTFENGVDSRDEKLLVEIKTILSENLIDCVCLLGGEPFDQELDLLIEFTNLIRSFKPDIEIYAYTGYNYLKQKDLVESFIRAITLKSVYVGSYSSLQNNQYWLSL